MLRFSERFYTVVLAAGANARDCTGMVGGEYGMLENPKLTAELNVFAFDANTTEAEQHELVDQLQFVRIRMRGVSHCYYYQSSDSDRWIEHIIWNDGFEPLAKGLTPAEAQGVLDKFGPKLIYKF